MAPRGKGLKELLEPSEKELEEARAVIASGLNQKKAKMASFTQWLKTYEGDDKEKMMNSRGEARQTYMLKYMANQSRKKGAVTDISSRYVHTEGTKHESVQKWLCKSQLENTFGAVKATKYIEILTELGKHRPDPLTGDDSDEMREYDTTQVSSTTITDDTQQIEGTATSSGATQAEIDALHDLSANDVGNCRASLPPPIKDEPLSEADKLEKRFTDFVKDPDSTMRFVTTTLGDLEVNIAKASVTQYCEELANDMRKFKTKVGRAKHMIMKAIDDPSKVKDKKSMFLVLDSLDPERKRLHAAAIRFGVIDNKRRRKE